MPCTLGKGLYETYWWDALSLSLWFGESICFLIELMFYPAPFTSCEESIQWFFQGSFVAYVMLQRHSTPVAVDFCLVMMISSRELCSICNASVPYACLLIYSMVFSFVKVLWKQSASVCLGNMTFWHSIRNLCRHKHTLLVQGLNLTPTMLMKEHLMKKILTES